MATDSFFTMMCGGLIALLFGLILCLGGYRLFLFLIPFWAFFFGFGLGAQSIQAIFGDAFLATITSWVVGFIVALIFAVLSYLFYVFAVALIAGSLGYALAVGLLQAIGMDFGLIVWLIGLAAGVVLAIVTIRFNLQKWVIIAATSFMGAGVIVGVFLALFGKLPSAELVENPVKLALQNSPFWLIVFLLVAAVGLVGQATVNRRVELTTWENRL
jgi:Ni,Fe-hydrogenase I cytochrome b subunit